MKISSGPPGFSPITLIIETPEELAVLAIAIGRLSESDIEREAKNKHSTHFYTAPKIYEGLNKLVTPAGKIAYGQVVSRLAEGICKGKMDF